jgi:hypothetical protein
MKFLAGILTASVLALASSQASANFVAGSVWFFPDDTVPGNATIANVPGGAPDVTFDAPSTPLSFASGGLYTVGEFLSSGGAFNVQYFNGHSSSDSLKDTLFDFTGNVTVNTGDVFFGRSR